MEDIENALDVGNPTAKVAIMIAGGGNFNTFYCASRSLLAYPLGLQPRLTLFSPCLDSAGPGIDQGARHAVVEHFPHIPIRSFPQSVWLGQPERTAVIAEYYSKHPDLHLAARDAVSYKLLKDNFGQYPNIQSACFPTPTGCETRRTPVLTDTRLSCVNSPTPARHCHHARSDPSSS